MCLKLRNTSDLPGRKPFVTVAFPANLAARSFHRHSSMSRAVAKKEDKAGAFLAVVSQSRARGRIWDTISWQFLRGTAISPRQKIEMSIANGSGP